MENDNSQPLLVVGVIPEQCFANVNDFVAELAKVLRIPIDTIQVIKGAKGEDGKKGDPGQRGVPGEVGPQGPPGQRTFASETLLDEATPDYKGQLAVRTDINKMYIADSTAEGDWELYVP